MIQVTRSMQKRMTVTLFASQSLFSASSIMAFTLMPIIAAHLSGSDSSAGVPPMVVMIGRSAAAYPAGWLMDRAGRRPGLCLGYLLAVVGGMVSVLSVDAWQSFTGFCSGGLLMGMGRGVIEQARFVAAEVYPPEKRASSIGAIVFAGTVGAIGGPLLVDPSGRFAESVGMTFHAGPYFVSTVLIALALILTFALLRPDPMAIGLALSGKSTDLGSPARSRPMSVIFKDGTVRFGLTAMIVGQFVMTFLMVITPLHMNHHAHGAYSISLVIMAHTLGMFGLSSLTGRLERRIGPGSVVLWGAVILAISAVLTPVSNSVPMLAISLFLLGLGWNFCFIAGSTLLSGDLEPHERGKAQGVGEALVALAAGGGSLATGAVFAQVGIVAVCGIGVAVSFGMLAMAWKWSGGTEATTDHRRRTTITESS